jgi:hypothetical protein
VKKLLITSPCFGEVYPDIFLNFHLKSLLDETNIPLLKDRINYIVYTDKETAPKIYGHKNFKRLENLCGTGIAEIPRGLTFDNRYNALVAVFKESVTFALKEDMLVSPIVCDLVFGRGYLPMVLDKMDRGHDAVFALPMRTAYESMWQFADDSWGVGAWDSMELCRVGLQCLHPLWVHLYWNSPLFSTIPYSLLWGNSKGLLVRSFSITPMVFQPIEEHLKTMHAIDIEIPGTFKNPYWAQDFIECPVIGVEPLRCYYPMWDSKPASLDTVKTWSKMQCEAQRNCLPKHLWYPCKATVNMDSSIIEESDRVVNSILEA